MSKLLYDYDSLTVKQFFADKDVRKEMCKAVGYCGLSNSGSNFDLSSPITGYTIGTNTALSPTDTLLAALGKLEAQNNVATPSTTTSGTYTTTNATPTNTVQFITLNDSSHGLQVRVIARSGTDTAYFNSAAAMHNTGGTLSTVGTQIDQFSPIQTTTLNGSAINIVSINSNIITVKVTGIAATTILWKVVMTTLSV